MTTQEKTIYTTPLLTLFSTDKNELKLRTKGTENSDIIEDALIEQFDIEDFYHTTEEQEGRTVYTIHFGQTVETEKLIAAVKSIDNKIMLLSKEDAISFVKACKTNNIALLGIDAFFVRNKAIQPSLENSIDFSSRDYVQKSESVYTDALLFLQDRSDELLFEVVSSETPIELNNQK